MKLKIIIPILVVLVIGLLGCTAPAAETSTATVTATATKTVAGQDKTTTATVTATTTALQKVYTLKFSTHHAPGTWYMDEIHVPFCEEVAEKSGGRLEVEMYGSQQLSTLRENLEAASSGICDLAYVIGTYYPEQLPYEQYWSLASLVESSDSASKLRYEFLLDEFLRPSHEKVGVHEIGGYIAPSPWFFSAQKQLNSIDDFKGYTARAVSKSDLAYFQALGGLPINISISEVYEALQKGVVDGAANVPATIYNYGWHETGKPGYLINVGGFYTGGSLVMMNLNVYNKLPGDLQQILNEMGYKWYTLGMSGQTDNRNVTSIEAMEKYGTQVIYWNDAEMARMQVITDPVLDELGDSLNAQGLKGDAFLAAYREGAEKYK